MPAASRPTPDAASLEQLIGAAAPISVAAYMELALAHPTLGYYRTRDPLGRAGDFTTAPEISQMFGELIGLWCLAVWQRPEPLRLVELGPGRGTLMADALRAIARVAPAFATDVHLVETSPSLRAVQAERLGAHRPVWHDRLEAVPAGPAVIIANEFLDALPVHQLVRTEGGWCERLVETAPEGGLRFGVAASPSPLAADLDARVAAAPLGSIAELAPARSAIAAELARRAAVDGSVALLIDYGYASPAPGDSLQAIRAHRFADPLAEPGASDLTTHVDFAALRAAAGDQASSYGPVGQGRFLLSLGIVERAERLGRNASAQTRATLAAALRRLIEPTAMGDLFKMLAIAPRHMPPPPGFES